MVEVSRISIIFSYVRNTLQLEHCLVQDVRPEFVHAPSKGAQIYMKLLQL